MHAPYFPQELRLRFLACREEWVAGLVSELEEGGAYEFLKRLTDVYRLHLFDVIMQYRAIFSDDSSQQVTPGRKTFGPRYGPILSMND